MGDGPPLDIDALYRQHGRMVLRRIRRFYPRDEADEVLHEVFERVLVKAATYRGDASPVTWLYQVTTRHCLNRLRDHSRRRELLEQSGPPPWVTPHVASNAEASTFLGQLWRSLDPDLAEIGTYYFVDGMTHAEIAQLLGASRRTVGNRIAEISAHARALYDEEGTP